MQDNAPHGGAHETPRSIDLVQSLDGEWLKLPFACMRECGPAVQTLGGLLAITRKETFVPVATIAHAARLKPRAVRDHLVTLDAARWVRRMHRQRTRAGLLRRTATHRLTEKTLADLARVKSGDHHGLAYGVLPWWACCHVDGRPFMPWCGKAVLSVVMARLMGLKAGIERNDGHGTDASDVWGSLECLGGDERFRMSLRFLSNLTGLTRESIVEAKRGLEMLRVINWKADRKTDGGLAPDLLIPNEHFRAVVTPTEFGNCIVEYRLEED